jgi:signal transduction histidine kinase
MALMLHGLCSQAAGIHKPEEAIAMVEKAIAYYKANGRAKAFEQINRLRGPFTDRELFTVVLDAKGVVLAHGAFHNLLGVNLMDIRDSDGNFPVSPMYKVVKEKGSGWVFYRWPNAMTKMLEPKATYVQGYDGLIFFCGYNTTQLGSFK